MHTSHQMVRPKPFATSFLACTIVLFIHPATLLCSKICLPCAPKLRCRTQLANFNVCMTREEYVESFIRLFNPVKTLTKILS